MVHAQLRREGQVRSAARRRTHHRHHPQHRLQRAQVRHHHLHLRCFEWQSGLCRDRQQLRLPREKVRNDLIGTSCDDFNFPFSPYNLTGALFEETEVEKYSSVVAVIRERDSEKITRFEDFKGKRACFGEFGGIGKIVHCPT